MGTKEEGIAGVIVRGYSGVIRPHQTKAGKCKACGDIVYIDAHESRGTKSPPVDRVIYVHYGCES